MKIVKVLEDMVVPNICACIATQGTIFERFEKQKIINGKKYWVYLMSNKQYFRWTRMMDELEFD